MRILTSFAAIGVACFATPVLASPQAGGAMQISAYVAPVCNLAANDFVVTGDGSLTGSVQEFCNASTGYQILASHRPLELSENATVRYGAARAKLDASGLSPIAFRSGQRLETVPIEIAAGHLAAPLSIAFVMSPV